MMITRPILRYPGGKYRLAPWIIAHFPPHSTRRHVCIDCGDPLPPGSKNTRKRCSDCQVLNHRKQARESKTRRTQRKQYQRTLRKTRYLGINCPKQIKVVDPLCDPYFISKNEFTLHRLEYAALKGLKVYIDGKEVELLSLQHTTTTTPGIPKNGKTTGTMNLS